MSHESQGKSTEWYTPKYIFDALECGFDMDVSAPVDRTFCHVPTETHLTERGLETDWHGFVWMNPPYGHQKDKIKWLNRFFDHGNGIALMPDRTSTIWWQDAAKRSSCILFVHQKIKFIKPDGSLGEQPGNGTCLFATGGKGVMALHRAELNKLGVILYKS